MILQKEDIRAAVLYLRSQGKKVTGLVGHSKGGTGVILYAAAYDDIPRVVNVAGRFDNMRGEHHCSVSPPVAFAHNIGVPSLPFTGECSAPSERQGAPARPRDRRVLGKESRRPYHLLDLHGMQKLSAGCAGIKERFGEDIFEYLEKHGQMEITWPSSDPASGGKKKWMLTHQVLLSLQCTSKLSGVRRVSPIHLGAHQLSHSVCLWFHPQPLY